MTLRPKNQNIPTIGAEKNTQTKRKRQTDKRTRIFHCAFTSWVQKQTNKQTNT